MSRRLGQTATLDDISDAELDSVAEMGFDWVWFLSVWTTAHDTLRLPIADLFARMSSSTEQIIARTGVMATQQGINGNTEAAILSRMVRPQQSYLVKAEAEAVLGMDFDRTDLDRLHELTMKNQDDALTPAERSELESYLRLSAFLDLMHAKARLTLKKHT
jgi:hypothetical protein